MDIARKLNQTMVYWAPLGSRDVFGRDSFSAGVEVSARWQDTAEEFINTLGERDLSAAVAYVDGAGTVPVLDGRVYLGTLASLTGAQQADPNLVQGAHAVRRVGASPSLDSGQRLVKLWTKV